MDDFKKFDVQIICAYSVKQVIYLKIDNVKKYYLWAKTKIAII